MVRLSKSNSSGRIVVHLTNYVQGLKGYLKEVYGVTLHCDAELSNIRFILHSKDTPRIIEFVEVLTNNDMACYDEYEIFAVDGPKAIVYRLNSIMRHIKQLPAK